MTAKDLLKAVVETMSEEDCRKVLDTSGEDIGIMFYIGRDGYCLNNNHIINVEGEIYAFTGTDRISSGRFCDLTDIRNWFIESSD